MLPERSSTSDTAVRGRAMVLALMLIVQDSPVSSHRTVTLPLATSPGLVEVYDSQMRAAAAGTIGSALTITDVPDGVPNPPVGPAVIRNVRLRQVTTSHRMARCVVTPTPPIPDGTLVNEMLGVTSVIDSAGWNGCRTARITPAQTGQNGE